MGDIRDRARDVLKAVPPFGQQITSNGATAAQFTKLTGGVTHATLVKNWEGGGIMTSCNAFVGWYAGQLGSTKYLGRFDLETFLPSIGKGNAWVKSTPYARPKYGDILRHTSFHVDVCLDFEGDVLTRAAAGQGGKSVGCDILKRVRGTGAYDYKKLQGWVDLELYFDSASPALPAPQWLLGWWKVMWRGVPYYYYFDRNNQAKWTRVAPQDTSQPPKASNDTGSVAIDSLNVTIRWGATGSVEKLSKPAFEDTMTGTWNDTEPLSAVKM
jgi:hypothetical protein